MDAITRHAQAQGEIFEALTFFNKAMSVTGKDKAPDYIKKISKLFEQDIITHLKTEESEIFPMALSVGTLSEKRLIRSLQREHINVLEKIDQFKDLVLKSGLHPNEEQMKEITVVNADIIELMLSHARKEDEELFPLLKAMGCRIEANKMRCD